MPLDIVKLRRDMNNLAMETWEKIVSGDRQGLCFREDSLTDHNLWMLARHHRSLNVHRFSQSQEKVTGADWEWWIGSDGNGWICLRIQAKRIYGRSYPRLDHHGNGDGDYQYDTLIKSCDVRRGQYPLHVLYNGWADGELDSENRWPKSAQWRACPAGKSQERCKHAIPEHYGCAVVSSFAVKAVHDHGGWERRLVARHLSNAFPWSYLFGYVNPFKPVRGDPREPNLVWATATWLDSVQATLTQMVREFSDGTEIGMWARDSMRRQEPRRIDALPAYADAVRLGYAEESVLSATDLTAAASRVIVLDLDTDDSEEEFEED